VLIKKIIPVNRPIITNQDAREVYKTVKSGWVSSSGSKIISFEKALCKISDRKYCSTVSNGTAALEIAIKSLGIKNGDEVIMPTFTIISNANAIIKNYAKPILVDSDLSTWNIDIKQIEQKITKRTKAIMLPHIYGFPNDMKKILKICKKYSLFLIEDAAEMIGQKYFKKPCGSFGDISIYSFYANKQITTGEGGALLTNSKNLFKKFLELRNLNFGKINRYNHSDISWNYRFTNIQAALGLSQIKRLKSIVRRKKEIGKQYNKYLGNLNGIILQPEKLPYANNIYWVFGLLLKPGLNKKKDLIQKELLKNQIDTRSFFWPMHKQTAFKKIKLFKKKKYPIADYLSSSGFYLPSGIGTTNKEIKYIYIKLRKVILKFSSKKFK